MRLLHITQFTLAAIVATSSVAYGALLEGGAVAAPDEYSAKVAAQVLKNGGNAVDAAVATAFTLAVTYPEAGNIGGGGFMTLYMDGKPYFLVRADGEAHWMRSDKPDMLIPQWEIFSW